MKSAVAVDEQREPARTDRDALQSQRQGVPGKDRPDARAPAARIGLEAEQVRSGSSVDAAAQAWGLQAVG